MLRVGCVGADVPVAVDRGDAPPEVTAGGVVRRFVRLGAQSGLSVVFVSKEGLKSSRFEICTLYCFVPVFASQLRTRRFAPRARHRVRGLLDRVRVVGIVRPGAGVVPPVSFGKSARISQVKRPVPVIFSKEAAVDGIARVRVRRRVVGLVDPEAVRDGSGNREPAQHGQARIPERRRRRVERGLLEVDLERPRLRPREAVVVLVLGLHAPVQGLGGGIGLLRGVLRRRRRDVVQLRADRERGLGRDLKVVLPRARHRRPAEGRRKRERRVVVGTDEASGQRSAS